MRKEREGGGGNYQSLINAALREHIKRSDEPLEATRTSSANERLEFILVEISIVIAICLIEALRHGPVGLGLAR